MRRTFGWAVIALFAVAAAAPGAKEDIILLPGLVGPPAPMVATKADPKVTQLIDDLGSDDYRTREKAGDALAALGERALPTMRAALLATDNPEVQRRLVILVRKMDIERLITPKKITLSLKGKSVKDALDAIAKQTGYKIDFSGGGGPGGGGEAKHDFEFERTPFWVAVDKVAAMAGCVVYADYDDETIRVYDQNAINPHVAYAGPFRFVATSINSNATVQLSGIPRTGGGNNRQQYMNLSFQIQSEPKNPMIGVMQAEVITAVDENGASLVPPKDQNRNRSSYYESRGNRGFNMYGNLNLNRTGDKSTTTLKTLKAKIGVVLLSGTTTDVVVADPLKLKNKTFIGRTMQMDFGSLVADPNQKGNYTLDVTLRKAGDSDPQREDYNWSNNVWNKLELLDADGNRYQTYGPNNINHNGGAIQVTIPYNTNDRRTGQPLKLGPPVKLVVNEWLSVTQEVTFEFKDIPLP